MRILNLFAGLGGNRKLWEGVEVTAVELDPKIAAVYQRLYPEDKVIVGDAFQYLLDHYTEFDFIWSSPPCQGNTRMIRSGRNRKPRYPDLRLYEQVIFLQSNFKGNWVVENVVPYYTPLIPAQQIGRHLFWSSFTIPAGHTVPKFSGFMTKQNLAAKVELQNWLGIHYEENIYYAGNHCPTQILRNCVHPETGLFVFNSLLNKQGSYPDPKQSTKIRDLFSQEK